MARLVASLVALALLAGCTQEAQEQPGLIGLASSSDASFTSTQDGTGLALLYSAAELRAGGKAPTAQDGIAAIDGRFELVSGSAEQMIAIEIAGALVAPGGASGALQLSVGGKTIDLSPALKSETFRTCTTATIGKGRNPISWKAGLDVEKDAEALLHIDSIDIRVLKADEPAQGCQPIAG